MVITTRNPADMTGQERMQEIAALLAEAIHRMHKDKQKQYTNVDFERSLTGLRPRMKRSSDHTENQSGDE